MKSPGRCRTASSWKKACADMDLGLDGKIAVVGGSSRGIGRAIAAAFLREGACTVVTGRDPASLAAAHKDLEVIAGAGHVHAVGGDLAKPETLELLEGEVTQKFGPTDCLVANIGSGSGNRGWETSEAEWAEMLDVNLGTSVRLVQRFLGGMIRAGSGSVVLVGSITGMEATRAPIHYSAAKAALASFSKNLARSVGGSGVRVNLVAPGNVLFRGGTWDKKRREDPEAVKAYLDAEVPLRRFATPEEIADLVVFLSSPRSAFVTGSCVVVDGGQTRGY